MAVQDGGPRWVRYAAVVIGFAVFAWGLSTFLTDRAHRGDRLPGGIAMAVGAALFIGACYLASRAAQGHGARRRVPPRDS
jgi:hypothetical protein